MRCYMRASAINLLIQKITYGLGMQLPASMYLRTMPDLTPSLDTGCDGLDEKRLHRLL